MDENKNMNFKPQGEDNEALFAQKQAPAKESPQGAYPAYRTRRVDTSAAPNERAAETMVRPPVKSAPEGAQQRAQRPAQAASQRSGAPQQRPAPNGARPASPRPPQGTRPAAAPQQRPRPAVNASPVQKAPAMQASPAAEDAAYKARRAPQGQTAAQNAANGTVVAPSPVKRADGQNNAVVPKPAGAVEKKKGQRKSGDGKQDASNAAQGATIMVNIVKAMAYMVLVFVVSVFISIFVIRVGNDMFAFVKSDEAIDITIPEDADAGDIAEILSDNGIINFPGIFKIYTAYKDKDQVFEPGDYTVSPSMSYDELRRSFKKQVVTGTVWITIPEGYTTDEIIDLLVENGIGERDKYIEVINNYDFDYWFIDELEKNPPKDGRVYRLEGYLFPDTYEFYKSSSEETVINRLLARFDEVFVDDYRTKAEELGYTVDEILTIASLIEKEAGGMGDFMYVSSVFHNRLKNPTYYPRLESDATTVYAIQVATGKRPDKITPEDNKFEHPYNTYLNAGLTPGPITNPSASAIRYALYPAKTSYYYFITDNAGKVYYASGIGEHEQNIALVKKINDQMENG